MKTRQLQFAIIFLLLIFNSCKKDKKSSQQILFDEVSGIVNLKNDSGVFTNNEDSNFENLEFEYTAKEEVVGLNQLYELPDSLKTYGEIPEIFEDYHTRNFITGVADKYNLIEALGHLYEKNADGKFKKISLKKLVTGKFEPKIEKVDKVYFKNVLIDSTQIAAGIKFLSIEASKSSKVELLVKDEITVLLPDENKDVEALKKVKQAFGDRTGNIYYSYGATLSSITNKTYNKSKWRPVIDASWFTFKRGKFKGQENFSYRSDVHVDLISLKDMVFPTVSENNLSNP